MIDWPSTTYFNQLIKRPGLWRHRHRTAQHQTPVRPNHTLNTCNRPPETVIQHYVLNDVWLVYAHCNCWYRISFWRWNDSRLDRPDDNRQSIGMSVQGVAVGHWNMWFDSRVNRQVVIASLIDEPCWWRQGFQRAVVFPVPRSLRCPTVVGQVPERGWRSPSPYNTHGIFLTNVLTAYYRALSESISHASS